MPKSDRAIKDLADAIYKLSQAVERLGKEVSDSQAKNLARSARSRASSHR